MALPVKPLLDVVKTYGPKLGTVISAVITFIAANPELPTKMLKTLQKVVAQVALVYLKRGDAAKAQGNVRIVRDAAPKLAEGGANSAGTVAAWLKRADNIEIALQVARGLSQADKKQAFADLRDKSEALLAEVLKVSIGE